jgi:Domain of unknown function (DUF4386)
MATNTHTTPGSRAERVLPGTSRIIGTLFLAGFLTYGVGNAMATTIAGPAGQGSRGFLVLGALLMLINSAVVISIGVLMRPILHPYNKAVAVGYLATRVFEGLGLAIGVGCLLLLNGAAAVTGNFIAYNIAMAGLGIGSLFFCALLFRSSLTPRFLAVWGFAGYAFFAAGSLLELSGLKGAGLVGAVPGGLFEVTFGIWLIIRGLRATLMFTDGRALRERTS